MTAELFNDKLLLKILKLLLIFDESIFCIECMLCYYVNREVKLVAYLTLVKIVSFQVKCTIIYKDDRR